MIYRLTYDFNGTPWSARYEAQDLDMAVAQAHLEDFRTKTYPLVSASVDPEGYGDKFYPVPV